MPRRKYEDLPPSEILLRMKNAVLSSSKNETVQERKDDEICTFSERIDLLLGILNGRKRKSTDMLFFVMYDIESNKVRTQVAKYLLQKGCFRIQKSIFLADAPRERMEDIKNDLFEVQACYDNHDSILIVPISTDYLQSMKVIGKDVCLDIIMRTNSTLFF